MRDQRASYIVVTLAYWAFMLSDGALRMLVLLHFDQLGFSPLALAGLFVVYELMGVITNPVAGWLGTRHGLKSTLLAGLSLQVIALLALAALDARWTMAVSVVYVASVQGLSGIAKDLTKTSAKSALKGIVADVDGRLFRLVALLTGSKNAIKGLGFLLGSVMLAIAGFKISVLAFTALLLLVLLIVLFRRGVPLGVRTATARLSDVWSTRPQINQLSAARLFLFGARDTWFVVGVPVFLVNAFESLTGNTEGAYFWTGTFMASWIIGYGVVQAMTPRWTGNRHSSSPAAQNGLSSALHAARRWNSRLILTLVPLAALALWPEVPDLFRIIGIISGLWLFGFVFAINSSLHSYLILGLTTDARATMDVGFYYMSNAAGRLVGTVLSGLAFTLAGLGGCLLAALLMATVARWCIGRIAPAHPPGTPPAVRTPRRA